MMITETPDLQALAQRSVWTAEDWRDAWQWVAAEPNLWRHVVETSEAGALRPLTVAKSLCSMLTWKTPA